jgi:DNA-binding transcriptional ArsR family regulator
VSQSPPILQRIRSRDVSVERIHAPKGVPGFEVAFTYSHIGIYNPPPMPRAATTSDVFNAIAEPRRRAILECLASTELPVGDLVTKLKLEQPSLSKHLRVLRDVGLVRVRRSGRHMFYRTNGEESAHSLSGHGRSSACGRINCCASKSARSKGQKLKENA